MNTDKDGTQHILCTDNDIGKEDNSLVSNFRGVSMAFDGKRMCSNTISSNDEALVFQTPIMLNGEHTYLRFSFIWDDDAFNGGYYELNGAWKGYDENGVPDNNIYELKSGDKIQLLSEMTIKDGRTEEIFGEEFTLGEKFGEISELPLDGQTYQYVYVITDIFGSSFLSDMATFEMQYTYGELLENPLPDDSYAAKVTGIEPYDS
jgi:hypothetical protein